MKKYKIGIIGLGVGEQHISGYLNHPQSEVIALCDFNEEKLDAIKSKYPHYSLTENAEEILENKEVDIVSIASYDHHHYDQIMKAIECDKHIFVEKPICLYEDHAREIKKALSKKPHLKISSNLILRKSPRFINLKDQIEKGSLGELYSIEGDYIYGRLHKITEGWRGKLDFYSVVYGGGVHIVDLVLWLTGDKVMEVQAFSNKIASKDTVYQYDDFNVALLKFKSGMIGKISSNFGCVYPHFHKMVIYGTKATFENDIPYARFYTSRDPGEKPQMIKDAYPGYHKGDFLSNFIDSIIHQKDPEIKPDEIFDSMAVCFAIEKSAGTQNIQNVKYF